MAAPVLICLLAILAPKHPFRAVNVAVVVRGLCRFVVAASASHGIVGAARGDCAARVEELDPAPQ